MSARETGPNLNILFPGMSSATEPKKTVAVSAVVARTAKKVEVDEGKQIFELFTLQTAISSKLFMHIPALVSYCNRISQEQSLDEVKKEQIRHLFFSVLPKLIKNQLLPFTLSGELRGKSPLQRVISPKLKELLEKNENSEELELLIAIEKVNLALKFGVQGQQCGGANGARIQSTLEGEKVGVFKRPQELSVLQVAEQSKKIVGQARLLSSKPTNRVYAEVAAYELDRRLGFNVVPAAKMCEIGGEEGAFVLFLHGFRPLSAILQDKNNNFGKRESYSPKELTTFQMPVLFDFITGNMDCHNDNLFMKFSITDMLEDMKIIDFGNAFILLNPGVLGLRGNQYAWGKLQIAQHPFTPEILEFIRTLSVESLESFIQGQPKEFMSEAMAELLRERFQVIKKNILDGSITTPLQLSQLHTDQDFITLAQKKL